MSTFPLARRLVATVVAAAGMVWLCCLPVGAAAPVHPATTQAATAGATTPFTSYEAEAGTVSGGASVVSLASAPTTQYSSPALEASRHAYVHLSGTGQRTTGVVDEQHRRADQLRQRARQHS
ncbi:MAG TPA: hypothetical protein VGN81_08470 [Pseudonocardiaceae bacterium]|jgi:hypothetical protein